MRTPPPVYHVLPKSIISTADVNVCLLRAHQSMTGDNPSVQVAWGTANRAFFVPIMIEMPVTIVRIGWENGTPVSGIAEAGVYTFEGKRLVTTGRLAQTPVSDLQMTDTPDLALMPGIYYAAMVMDNTTGQVRGRNTAMNAQGARTEGYVVQDLGVGGVLPAQATFASPTTSFVPVIILQLGNSVL